MVAMKMADKDMMYPAKIYFRFPKLNLCSFTTINQKKMLMYIQNMSTWKFR